MNFPNASKGIRNIFTAEILTLIATLATVVTLILTVVFAAGSKVNSDVAMGASGIGVVVFSAGAAVLAIIALILKIVGVVQASKDEPSFGLIIKLTIFAIIISVIAAFFGSNGIINNIATAISNVISLICSILVITGIANLAISLKNSDVVESCGRLLKIILWIGILALLLRFFGMFIQSNAGATIVIILLVISMILTFVQYILYISLLAKAKKMLQ